MSQVFFRRQPPVSRPPRGLVSPFPIAHSSDSRYFVDAQGNPRPIKGRTSWSIVSLGKSAYQAYLADTLARKFNTIEMWAIFHWPVTQVANTPTPPFAGDGSLPFLKRLDGANWSGALTYSNINNEGPDFTTPNPVYWDYLEEIVRFCQEQSIYILFFPSYVGYVGSNQGWGLEVVANGQTKMQTYGTFCANRFAKYTNLMWMLGGDKGTAPNTFNTAENNAQQGQVDGLKGVVGARSVEYGAEWEGSTVNGYSYGPEQSQVGAQLTVHGLYAWAGQTGAGMRAAYQAAITLPNYWMEGVYEGEEPAAINFNPNVVLPTRHYAWNAILNGAVGGVCTGNGYVWPFGSDYLNHLNDRGTKDLTVLWNFIDSIALHRLVPTGLGGIGTLITAGAGSIDTTNYVSVAATTLGDLLVAYSGPGHSGSFTLDMTKLRGTITARWLDPTSGVYSSAGGPFANTGTQAFTPPTNGVGESDYVLRLDA